MIVVSRQLSIFSVISWREQVYFQRDDDKVRLERETDRLSWIFIVLAHWNMSADGHVATLGHIILISSQAVFALFLSLFLMIPA